MHITGAWLRYKAHPPNKRCAIRDKTMCLTDEYDFNSEVCQQEGYMVCQQKI